MMVMMLRPCSFGLIKYLGMRNWELTPKSMFYNVLIKCAMHLFLVRYWI